MRRPIHGFSLLTAALVLASGCSDHGSSSANADSALTRDLTLASQVAAEPTLQDTAVAPTPAPAQKETPAPAQRRTTQHAARRPAHRYAPPRTPAAEQPAPSQPTPTPTPAPTERVAAGTAFGVTSGNRICTATSRPGDKIVATLNAPVTGTGGATIPAGARVVLQVADVQSGNSANNSNITFRATSVYMGGQSYPIEGTVLVQDSLERTKVPGQVPNSAKKRVGGGAVIGAILGGLIGHSTKGAVIGAATGAAAGAISAKASEKWEACLPAGSTLQVTLDQPLVLAGN